jgi:hypothetical protein
MESNGAPGQVNISADTFERKGQIHLQLPGKDLCEKRGRGRHVFRE